MNFAPESLHDPELQRIARATEVVADPQLTAIYEQRKPCDVTLYLRDGRALNERVDYCRGEPENPASETAVVGKFRDLTGTRIARATGEKIIDFVLDIDRQKDLSPVGDWLAGPAATP